MWAREIGLDFEMPLAFDTLKWDRRSEYSFYPKDHIGRPIGEAVAHPDVAQNVPPGERTYALDDHPWGSNDYRSVKRNIYWASVTNDRGQGIKVISDGSQHIRAIVGVHTITVHVLDFYGGSGSPHTYSSGGFHYGGGKEIKTGDVIEGVIRMQLLGGP
jgi:beta-galactosidase